MKDLKKKELKLIKLSSKTMKVIKAGSIASGNCDCGSCHGCDAISVSGVIQGSSGTSYAYNHY